MEVKARGFPVEATGGRQASRDAFEVRHRFRVVDVVNRYRQHRLPVFHDSDIFPKPSGNVLDVIRPAHAAEIGHPARHRNVAQIPSAVYEDGIGKQQRKKSNVKVVVGHLVNDAFGLALVQFFELIEMLSRKVLDR